MTFVENNVLARIRSEVCDTVLVWLLGCAGLALTIVFTHKPEFISDRMFAGYAGLFGVVTLVTLMRRKLPYTVRAGVVILVGLIAGISRLILYGLPYGMVPLAISIIWSALFFGERFGIAVATTVLAMFGTIYLGFTLEFIPLPSVTPPPMSDSTWLISAAVLAATTLGPLIAVSRVSQKLEFERQQAESTSAAKSDFLATMGHELKTPLNAIMGFAEALGLGYAGSPGSTRYREYTSHIHTSAQHLLSIVDDLLELARTNAVQHKALVEELGVATEVKRAIATVDSLLVSAGLTLRLSLAEDLPPIAADATLFRQIMINLLSNAIKFTPSHGTVSVTAGVNGKYIRIEVSDTGIGIPEDQIPNLFQPFRPADHAAARAQQGSGLGLALAKSFTELLNGRLLIRSEPGVGTTATVEIPMAAPRLPQTAA